MEPFGEQEVTPHYFICPISLQVMQDPVTAPTGITYDRHSIERWLAAGHATCPVTNQPLSSFPAGLTPNHTLRRLIQSWHSAATAPAQVQPPSPVAGLLRELSLSRPPLEVLGAAATLASESDTARCCMVQSGVARRVLRLIVSCAETTSTTSQSLAAIELCLSLLHSLKVAPDELRQLVADNHDLVDALTRVLLHEPSSNHAIRANTVLLLKSIAEVANAALLERLKPELFRAVTAVIHDRISSSATRAALHILLHACPNGRNRARIAEAGAVHEAIELELDTSPPEKRTTELVMALLDKLCACADGRAALGAHSAGIAVVAKRVLRVSPATDASAVRVLAAVGGRAASPEVVQEMARVGAVAKLCCVLQADCSGSVKETARGVVRLHSGVWKTSPCISAYLLARYP